MNRDFALRPVGRAGRLVFCAVAMALSGSLAMADAYDAPATYYQNATGAGETLKQQLKTIVSSGFVARSYGDARFWMEITDRDPNNSNNILLAYNRASVEGTWDQGVTYNREHVFPRSYVPGATTNNSYVGMGSDLFELRPTNPNINSSRGNLPYGTIYGNPPATYGSMTATNGSGTYWNPGADRGDVARALFYMATRYAGTLSLKNGQPSVGQMGDLESLLHWHYTDQVDNFERRKNQYTYSQALNPQYYQGNRNPFIDHPEYVWTIFGNQTNNSQLSVATPAADGSSSLDLDFGRVIAGSNFTTRSVTLSKTGTTPTTFDVSVSGSIDSTLNGPRQGIGFGAQSKSLTVSITGSTSTVGDRSGTITFDNTDIDDAPAAGQGAADGNDVINVSAAVVAHADPSFSLSESKKTLNLDFGIVARDAVSPELGFEIANFSTIGNNAFTAGLDLDNVTADGNAAAFATDLATATNLTAGTSLLQTASLITTAVGSFDATFSIAASDENIPGATALGSLLLSLHGQVAIGGDANLDNTVSFDDLLILAQNYGGTEGIWQIGDFNRDSQIGFDDLLVLAQNYGGSAVLGEIESRFGQAFAADWALARSLVPEPTLLSGLAVMTLIRRRR